jgi:hypothetical protein
MKAIFNTEQLNPMQKGRLEKSLLQKFRFSEGIYTLKDYIEKYAVDKYIATVATKTGTKQELSIKTKDGQGIDIPKIVYDALNFEPTEQETGKLFELKTSDPSRQYAEFFKTEEELFEYCKLQYEMTPEEVKEDFLITEHN